MDKEKCNTKLRQFRLDSDLKQIHMADTLGISQPAMAALERRGIRQVSTAQKYAEKLGISALSILEIY